MKLLIKFSLSFTDPPSDFLLGGREELVRRLRDRVTVRPRRAMAIAVATNGGEAGGEEPWGGIREEAVVVDPTALRPRSGKTLGGECLSKEFGGSAPRHKEGGVVRRGGFGYIKDAAARDRVWRCVGGAPSRPGSVGGLHNSEERGGLRGLELPRRRGDRRLRPPSPR